LNFSDGGTVRHPFFLRCLERAMLSKLRVFALAAVLGWLTVTVALAGEAQVSQITPGSKSVSCDLCDLQFVDAQGHGSQPFYAATAGPPNTNDIVQVGDGNVAVGVSIGHDNYIGQFQLGDDNQSAVGLIADAASVTVVQDGDGLKSNLLVWGNPGAPIGVYQPPGSAPVKAAILTAADGTQVILPGNATTIIRR
jgi:hypothetical protein